jgi:hydrogenase/urease accessory protein HupE
MIRILRALTLGVACLWCPATSFAHEIRPALLEIKEAADQHLHITWKQPVVGDVGLPLRPTLSSGWLDAQPTSSTYNETYLIRRWSVREPMQALAGQRLTIDGLQSTLTDVLIRIESLKGKEQIQLIKPDAPTWTIPASSAAGPAVPQYLVLGIEHIWTGIDHLLFVLGLMLLVTGFRELLKTITAFTLAHSMTLGAAALGWVHVAPAPVEAVIALSILYLAVQLTTRAEHARLDTFTRRYPWVIALCFGLLHGFGFAGALSEVGLPDHSIAMALLLFNVGIELGQIAFVAGVLVSLRVLEQSFPPRCSIRVRWALPQVIGSLAAFWFIERTVAAFV